jgi:hypothetical protein
MHSSKPSQGLMLEGLVFIAFGNLQGWDYPLSLPVGSI